MKGDYEKAVEYYLQGHLLDPLNASILYSIGISY